MPVNLSDNGIKVVVYTVCVDQYDVLQTPPITYPNIDYIAFTDNPDTVVGWETVPILTGTTRRSRLEKIQSRRVREYLLGQGIYPDVLIYIDSCLFLSDNWYEQLRNALPNDLKAYNICKHGDNLSEHFDKLKKIFKGDTHLTTALNTQERRYFEQLNIPRDCPVTENCMIVRAITDNGWDDVDMLDNAWWEEYCVSSRRDQLSLSKTLYCFNSYDNLQSIDMDARNNKVYSNWCNHKKVKRVRTNNPDKQPKRLVPIHRDKPPVVCVCTTMIRPPDMPEETSQFYDFCIGSIRNFADRNNYRYHEITESSIYPHPSWERLRNRELFDAQPDLDAILYIDADVWVRPEATSPIDYYELDSIVALDSASTYSYMRTHPARRGAAYKRTWRSVTGEKLPYKDTNRYINAGVMIIPRNCVDILDDPPHIISDGTYWEQTYLNYRVSEYPYIAMDHRWNWGHVHVWDNFDQSDRGEFIHFNTTTSHPKYLILELVRAKIEGRPYENLDGYVETFGRKNKKGNIGRRTSSNPRRDDKSARGRNIYAGRPTF